MSGWVQRRGPYEYIWEAMDHVEEKQCRRCVFSKLQDPDTARDHAEDYPMCYEIEGEFLEYDGTDEPMLNIFENPDGTVYCNKFEEV